MKCSFNEDPDAPSLEECFERYLRNIF
ncbi:MAG: hypothetical protein ACLT3O_08510 [Blautia massiliensis (ex Durand et al. 2017)]